LTFVGRKGSKPVSQTIELEGMTIAREPKFLSENLVIFPATGRGAKYSFVFPRSRAEEVERIGNSLRANLGSTTTAEAPFQAATGV
jgi:hypothetical protein